MLLGPLAIRNYLLDVFMDSSQHKLDPDRVEKVLKPVLEAVKQNLMRGPADRMRMYENLNALAIAVAVNFDACGDPEAIEFFALAVEHNQEELRQKRENFWMS
jgi:hypothetical protein